MDTNLLWLWIGLALLASGLEMKYHDEFLALRENMVNSDMGKFEYDDFK